MPMPSEMFNACENAETVTPSDTVNLSQPCRKIYVGVGGDIALVMAGNAAVVTLVGVVTGTMLEVAAIRVNATNTDATTMVAFF